MQLIVANQFTTQLTDEIRDAVFGNMGTIVAFRVGQNDVDALARYFQPAFDTDDLLRVPNFNTIARTLIGGVPTQSFSMATLPPLGTPNAKLATALKQLSGAKFGHPKAEVERAIFERMATKAPPQPVGTGMRIAGPAGWAGSPAGLPTQQRSLSGNSAQSSPAARPVAQNNASFLDQWLAKREQPQARGSASGYAADRSSVVQGSMNGISSQNARAFQETVTEKNDGLTPGDTVYIDQNGSVHRED